MRRQASPFRLLRAGAIAGTVLVLAAGAHVLGGGALPAPLIMAALTALTILGATMATLARITLPAMTGLLGASQLALHQGFDLLGAPAAGSAMPAGPHAMHSAAEMAAALGSAATLQAATLHNAALQDAAHMGGGPSLAMIAAHTAATLLAAVVLARGEAALWALAGWLRPLFIAALATVPLPAAFRPRPVPAARPFLPWRSLRINGLRGPPLTAIHAV
ncbi:hypothetical protein [Specibacter cremeus]|uniref:hypothetical protein n=1 Tax=Specibacter cremeus TaxID=1629051 RepID=UPI000F7B5815|nr:hypothetical protein [Specibacter cremeus]